MAILRLRKKDGSWAEIPALIGPQGEQGTPGIPAAHTWNGTVLTVTSANGVSSADLKGAKGDKGDKGDPFTVAKVYDSVSAMNRGYSSDGVMIGGFVVVETGNVDDEDNAKLYIKGESRYEYLTDLSGSQGMTGPRGEKGEKGDTGETGNPGVHVGSEPPPDTANVWIDTGGDYGSIEEWEFTLEDESVVKRNIIIPPERALIGLRVKKADGTWLEIPAIKGDKGDKGDPGEKGATGATGAVGATGSDGVSCTHSWNGTTLTVSSASGTSSANLKGDKGDKGDPGEKGATGATGATGPAGTTSWNGITDKPSTETLKLTYEDGTTKTLEVYVK